MTEKLNTQVTLPAWLITLISTLFMTFMIFSITQVKANQDVQTKTELAEKERDNMQAQIDQKADRAEIDRIYTTLYKMNEKLDRLIENQ